MSSPRPPEEDIGLRRVDRCPAHIRSVPGPGLNRGRNKFSDDAISGATGRGFGGATSCTPRNRC